MPKRLKADYSETNYTIIPQNIIQGSLDESMMEALDIQELAIWVYLLNHSDEFDLSTGQIAERFDRTKRFVRKVLTRLEEKGLFCRNEEENHPSTGAQFVVADYPTLLEEWERGIGVFGDNHDSGPPTEPESNKTESGPETETGEKPSPKENEQAATEPPDDSSSEKPEQEKPRLGDREDEPVIPMSLTERLTPTLPPAPGVSQSVVSGEGGPITDGLPIFTDPPYEPDRKPIRHHLPYHWHKQTDRLDSYKKCEEDRNVHSGGGGMSIPTDLNFFLGGRNVHSGGGGMSIPTHTTNNKEQVISTNKPKQRYSKVRRQRASVRAALSPNAIASKNLQQTDLDRSRNRWLSVFGERDERFYSGVTAYVLAKDSNPPRHRAGDEGSSGRPPRDGSQIQPKTAGEELQGVDAVKMAYRAIWIEPFEEEEDPPTTPTGEDRQLAKDAGTDPEPVMLLRQISEGVIDIHAFDFENTYDSPGRDPWAVRMFAELAYPNANVKSSQKAFIDREVGQALPKSPSDWARILLRGLRRGWSPDYPENFTKAYRHFLDIERDPKRPPMAGGRRMDPTSKLYGNDVNLTEVDLRRIAPDQTSGSPETEDSAAKTGAKDTGDKQTPTS